MTLIAPLALVAGMGVALAAAHAVRGAGTGTGRVAGSLEPVHPRRDERARPAGRHVRLRHDAPDRLESAPRIVHSGPECFAGASPQQVSRSKGD